MSMHRSTNVHEIAREVADRKQNGYGFFVVLACAAILLVIASAFFAPPISSGELGNETWLLGP
jgi:hypothetical protein